MCGKRFFEMKENGFKEVEEKWSVPETNYSNNSGEFIHTYIWEKKREAATRIWSKKVNKKYIKK